MFALQTSPAQHSSSLQPPKSSTWHPPLPGSGVDSGCSRGPPGGGLLASGVMEVVVVVVVWFELGLQPATVWSQSFEQHWRDAEHGALSG